MNADDILPRLDKVKANGANKWAACCPAHDDTSPSLSVRDAGDRVLLHCFGGCSISDICTAIGISINDLFADSKKPREIIPGVTRRDVVDTLVTEILICEIAESDKAAGKPISEADLQRAQLAREFIRVASAVNHG